MLNRLRSMVKISEDSRVEISWKVAVTVFCAMIGGSVALGAYMARLDDTVESNRMLKEKVDKIDRNLERVCYALNEALETRKKTTLPCDRMQDPKRYGALTTVHENAPVPDSVF